MAPEDGRPDPDALLAATVEEGRGRPKVFLGSAPDVGKTWEMLVQAKRHQAQGADVLAGVIETHGHAGTEAELKGLPMLSYRDVPNRGQMLKEFDLEADLTRRPGGMVEATDGRIEAHSPRSDLPVDGHPGTIVNIWLPATQAAA